MEAAPGERRIDKHHNSSFENTGLDAATLIADLNVALTWLDYPGRKNRAIGVGELEF